MMRLNALYLRNFRNYKEAVVEFSPKVNFIFGENAQGKTNLLEAIYLLITGRSFRTTHLHELIYFDAEEFYLEAHFEKRGIEQTLKMQCNRQGRKIYHNATTIPTLSSLLGILIGVILTPEDHDLVEGSPSARRRFLDLQIAQVDPFYLHHLMRYHKAMKHRNCLLRQRSFQTIGIWEEEMAKGAAYLTEQREKTTRELEKEGHFFQQMLSGEKDHLNLRYKSSLPQNAKESSSAYFLKQFQKGRMRESELGSTLIGPHKDDLTILLKGNEARSFASEGQKFSCVAALRFAEWSQLKEISQETPLFCIDDVGMSFDNKREENLYEHLDTLGQIFLTSPRLSRHLPQNTHLIHIENGSLTAHAPI